MSEYLACCHCGKYRTCTDGVWAAKCQCGAAWRDEDIEDEAQYLARREREDYADTDDVDVALAEYLDRHDMF